MSASAPAYAELHCHSGFSLLDGASNPEDLIARAHELGYRALALTDHDELGGAVRFAECAKDVGLPAIIGAELTVDVPHPTSSIQRPPSHLVLLAESREGYGNLSTLITRARMDTPRGEPRVPLDLVAKHASGLFALTGCPRGWVPSLLARGDRAAALGAAGTLAEIFEGRLAIECWDHRLPEERAIVRQLIPLARALDLPWVVTNDVHYAHREGRIVHDVLCAIRHQRTLDEMGTRLRPNAEWHLKSPEQMQRRWRERPEGFRATLDIAERCEFRMDDVKPTLPPFPLPPGVTTDEYLARLVEQGANERWTRDEGLRTQTRHPRESGDPGSLTTTLGPRFRGDDTHLVQSRDKGLTYSSSNRRTPAHDAQLKHELDMIARLGLAGFFLIVWDIVRFARRKGILCQGRGSAANSAVCYCLGITAVDPVKMKLLFERFLSEERREAPDIDLDIAHRDREIVLQYVYDRYGREHAAMVCEQITYRGRSAIRDAARVLGYSQEQANELVIVADRFSATATAEALRGTLEKDAGRGTVDGGQQHEAARPVAKYGRKRDASGSWSAEVYSSEGPSHTEAIARAFSQQMIPGTEANTRARAVKEESKRTPSLRSTKIEKDPSTRAPLTDPHAEQDHNERRNPTTATRPPSTVHRPPSNHHRPASSTLANIVAGLHQLPRHRSIHVGGFVLTEEPLSTVVPIEPASMADRTVIQWEKDDLDPIGLVKIDLLGLGMLTLIQDCLKYIRQTRGVTIELSQLDMEDQAVYDDMCNADTIGIFQIESRAQMNTLPRLKPRCFYDIVVEVAIIRPGPIQGDMVHPYLRRRAGEEPVTYPHPSLEPILERTLGVPLFQEQGMQVAIAAAGFSPGEADTLRRAMGHKRSHERMAAICEKLLVGMRNNGIAEDIALRIYNQINAFADYGFPESHAASFALLVYASAYLKHYYAPEFTAAILNAQPMGFYAPGTLIEDAQRHGVEVRPVDLTCSTWDASLEGCGMTEVGCERDKRRDRSHRIDAHPQISNRQSPIANRLVSRPLSLVPAVRLGLRSVRGLGAKARDKLERALADGPFISVEDVVRRSSLDRRSLRLLAECGAFDSMFPNEPHPKKRRAALWEMLETFRGAAGPLAPLPPAKRVKLPAMSRLEITEADYRVTGLSLNGHPMEHLRAMLKPKGVLSAAEVLAARDGSRIATAGLVICRQRPGTAKGFVFLTLEDETGLVNVVVTPKRFERDALLIATTPLLLVRGVLQIEQRVVNLKGETFAALGGDGGAEWAGRHDFH